MTKVLLLGIGRWGANHLRSLNSLPIELYVAELDAKRLEAARKAGLPESRISTSYKDFAGQVDAAVVVTPAQTHYPLCAELLEAGKDVFVEKPLTLVASESLQLAELAARQGRILQVGHIFRYDPATQWLRAAIQEGRFGRVQHIRGHFGGFKRPRNDSGVMFADAIHFVDLYNFLLGRTPDRVLAVMRDFLGRGMDDATLLSLEYGQGAEAVWATVDVNYFIPGKFREVIVIGDKLSAVCDYNLAQNKIKTYENRHVKDGNDFKTVENPGQVIETAAVEPLLAELKAFVASVETRQAPLADGRAGYDSVRVLEAALASARLGAPAPVRG